MKETGILMKPFLVDAALQGMKTETRRLMKVQPPSAKHVLGTVRSTTGDRRQLNKHHWVIYEYNMIVESDGRYFNCPYGYAGDRIYARETFFAEGCWIFDGETPTKNTKLKFIDNGHRYLHTPTAPETYFTDRVADLTTRWWKRPAIFMPRDATRLIQTIGEVRYERLQDITEAAAIAEGIQLLQTGYYGGAPHEIKGTPKHYATAREAFFSLWDCINGDKAKVEDNPMVWVLGGLQTV